jgi:hypothetical protein
MNNTRFLTLVLCIGAIIVWVFNGYTAVSFFFPHPIKSIAIGNARDIFLSRAMASTDSALKIMPELRSYRFPSAMENPFRLASEADPSAAKRHPGQAPETQIKLLLKGVLLKSRPLAILEDPTGKTYICGVGETVCGQFIVEIEATRVALRNNLGSYSLIVKE